MPVTYSINKEIIKKPNYSEDLLDIFYGTITTILKNRLNQVPSRDDIKEHFMSVLKLNENKLNFDTHLIINLKEANGNKTIIEDWNLSYKKLNSNESAEYVKEKHFRSSEAPSFYKSVYYFIKEMPISEQISKQRAIKEQISFELKLNKVNPVSQLTKKHQFTNLLSKKRHLINLNTIYESRKEEIEKTKLNIQPPISSPIDIPVSKPAKFIPRPNSPLPAFNSFSFSPGNFLLRNKNKNKSGCSEALVGSYEQSLLSGRMSTFPSKSIEGFTAKIGALSRNQCIPHVVISFAPTFYQHDEESSSPYVGDIELGQNFQGSLKIPKEGKLQIVLKNPSSTAVQLFLVPYNFKDIPNNHKTFLRHKTYISKPHHPNVLRHAIHLHFGSDDEGNLYLYKNIKVVFTLRAIESYESTFSSFDLPPSPIKYSHIDLIDQRIPDITKDVLAVAGDEDTYLGYH